MAAMCYLDEDFRDSMYEQCAGFITGLVTGSHIMMRDLAKQIITEPDNQALMTYEQFENMKEDDYMTGKRKKGGMKTKYG